MKKSDYIEEQETEPKDKKKKTISPIIKIAIPVLLSVAIVTTIAIVSCDKGPDTNPPEPPPIVRPIEPDSSDPGKDPPDSSIVTPTPPVPAQIPTEEIAALVQDLKGGNFTYTLTTEGNSKEVTFDENIVKVVDGETIEIFSVDEENNYCFKLQENGLWTKDFATGEELSSDIYDMMTAFADQLSQVTWESYDEETKTVKGTMSGASIELIFTEEGCSLFTGESTVEISEIGTTIVSEPTENVIDNTVENIYEIVNGEYVFNHALIYETIDNWLRGDNQWGMDVASKKYFKEGYKTEKIVYLDCSPDLFNMVLIYSTPDGELRLAKTELNKSALYNGIKNGEIKTKDAFIEQLKTLKIAQVDLGAMDSQDTLTMDCSVEEMQKMNANIFNELENKGTRGESVENDMPETKIKDFSQAEILFSFKGKPSVESAGLDLGYMKYWTQYYVVKFNDKIEFVEVEIASSTTNAVETYLDNVINNTKDWWYVTYVKRAEISSENEALFEVDSNEIIYTGEKNKELS